MGNTSISWTHMAGRRGVSWNPVRGCSPVSPGCAMCYAGLIASRFCDAGQPFHGFAERNGKAGGGKWTGEVSLLPGKLAEPLSWREPRCCFVNSMSDLFHESLSFEEIAAVVGVVAASEGSIFQVLTKRASRAREWFDWVDSAEGHGADICVVNAQRAIPERSLRGLSEAATSRITGRYNWPVPNLWLGVSTERQKEWDEREEDLQLCPATVRFVSAEPLLGPIDCGELAGIHQVIVGAESGPGARPMKTEWAASIRDQCRGAGVAFYMKQFASNGGRKVTNRAEWPGGAEAWPQEFPVTA